MNETDYLAKRLEYNYASIEDKHYFGGYFNLAQNNINDLSKAFKEKFGMKPKSCILDFFTQDKAIAEYQLGVEFLQKNLPVIRYLYLPTSHKRFENVPKNQLISEQRNYFKNSLKVLKNLIRDYRNFYTHHFHKPIPVFPETYKLLDDLFLAVANDVKKHRMKTDASKQLLKKGLIEELAQLEKLKLEDLKKLKREGKKVNLNDKEAITNAILNDSFSHLLPKENTISKYYSAVPTEDIDTENGVTISESGIIFLLGLFLTKKQSEDLRSRVKGFKAKLIVNPENPINKKNNSLKYMATHWVFGYLGFKGLKNRFTTTFTKDTLLAQIVDELSKVPDELYQVLPEELKNEFLEDMNEYLKEENSESLDKATVIHPVIRKRYENKFAYFALRFLDEFVDFPTLRFQLHLGNYVHDKREKPIEGTKYVTERIVKEKIKAFAKLSEAAQLKQKYFEEKENHQSIGLQLYPNPSYNFVGNNIPIHLNLNEHFFPKEVKIVAGRLKKRNSSYKSDHPEEYKVRTDNKIKPDAILQDLGKPEKLAPVATLSLNELPALLHLVLTKKTPEEIEIIIAQKIAERYNVLTNYKAGDDISKGQITKNLLKAKQKKEVNLDKLQLAIEKEIAVTNDKLQTIALHIKERNDPKQKRKYVFTNKEIGLQVTWLANDLKRFMPKGSRQNWRGQHHSQLQKSLAFYDIQPKEPLSLLEEVWDFKNEAYLWNNGIRRSFDKRDFISFYTSYLNNRKETFQRFKDQLNGIRSNKKILDKFIKQQHLWNLFHKRLYVIDTIEEQVEKLLVKPMQFPKGVFDHKPTYIKGKSIQENPECFADWYVAWNQHTDYQKFYSWDRDYKSAYLSGEQEKTEKRFIRVQGSKINKVKQQDVLLAKMASIIFNELYLPEDAEHLDLNLSDIYKTQTERKAEIEAALIQSHKTTGDNSANIIKSTSAWTLTVPYCSKNIYEPQVKLKELGKFKKFIASQKVQTLFEYKPQKIWNKTELEEVLELKANSYEVIRRDYLLKSIQEFEKYMIKKLPTLIDTNEHPNFNKYLTTFLKSLELVSEEDAKWLISKKDFDTTPIDELKKQSKIMEKAFLLVMIRNKFSHNQLPRKIYYDEIYKNVPNAVSINFNELFLEYTNQTILEFK